MTDYPGGRESRICITESGHDLAERVVLGGFVGSGIDSFEFHADRKVVAGDPPPIAGLTGMPRSISELDELGEAPIARHEQV